MNNWPMRAVCVAIVATAGWYGTWMFVHMNMQALWLALPFVAANVLIMVQVLITAANNWQRTSPALRIANLEFAPTVAVIIPCCGEPPAMVARTAESVLQQNWPPGRLKLIISDDAHAPDMHAMTDALQREHRHALVLYHQPPPRGSAERRGEAKAGNLNSALDLVLQFWGDVEYIETRDADDEVGDWSFLRHCIGQLQTDPRIAYVQTIKEARVSEGDPFANLNGLFFRGTMRARNAANAVIPCGSGLVWRRAALVHIGGFPTWNLVEDLQSGLEALRRGWRGVYLPIVGAIGQHAPEDMPNVYKQSGTWALDTMRLFIWGNKRGLSFRQRLHFIELGLFYLQSFSVLMILLTLAVSLFTHTYPLSTTQLDYTLHFWPFALAIELFLVALNGRQRYEALLRQREVWMGLTPIYIKACVLALLYGPHRKPVYRVTRKVNQYGWYWRETLPQLLLFALVAFALIYGAATTSLLTDFDIGSAYWALFYGTFLFGFIRKSWFRGKPTRGTWHQKRHLPMPVIVSQDRAAAARISVTSRVDPRRR
ncbi:MAG: glycosyltransferase family 2 protein [Ktedonobacterales bacterium]